MLHLSCFFFSVIIVNALNKDQLFIQIKRVEKVEHIQNAQRYTHQLPVTVTDGPLYISHLCGELTGGRG